MLVGNLIVCYVCDLGNNGWGIGRSGALSAMPRTMIPLRNRVGV